MTPQQMREIMIRQELSHNDMATIHDVSYRQVTSWLSGAYAVPRGVAVIMKALDERKVNLDWLMDKMVEEMKEKIDA